MGRFYELLSWTGQLFWQLAVGQAFYAQWHLSKLTAAP
jgi:hypothetical protein